MDFGVSCKDQFSFLYCITINYWIHNNNFYFSYIFFTNTGTMDVWCLYMFVDRGVLNTSTGALTIKGLARDDSGSYTPEINDKVKATKELRVICEWRKTWMKSGERTGMVWLSLLVFSLSLSARVSKPSLSRQCDAENKYCVFTCEGNTTDAEPITFRWRASDYVFESSNVNVLHIWKV